METSPSKDIRPPSNDANATADVVRYSVLSGLTKSTSVMQGNTSFTGQQQPTSPPTLDSPRKSIQQGIGKKKKPPTTEKYKLVETKIVDEEDSGNEKGGAGGQSVQQLQQHLYEMKSAQEQSPDQIMAIRRSLASMTSSAASIGLSKFPHAQEVSETAGTKTKEILLIIVVLILNVLLLNLGIAMKSGLQVMVSPTLVAFAGGVVIEILLLVTNIMTIHAMDVGAGIFIASLIVKKKGYSMAACGFMQSTPFHRLKFTGQLSLNSPCRKSLQRVAYLWFIAEIMKILSPIGATGVLSESVRTHADTITCIVYSANTANLRDRLYPTLTSTAGVAEFLFGNAIGCMRSERDDCPANGSQFVFGPQLDGVVGSGDTILGNGFQMLVATTCECTDISKKSVLVQGIMTPQDQKTALFTLKNITVPFTMYFSTQNVSTANFMSYMMIGNMQICGGVNSAVVPVCQTNINSFQDAQVAATFMTDGTTASIALVNSVSEIVSPSTTVTTTAVAYALNSIWVPGQPYPLVSNVAGMMNALLYWTSTDLVSVDPTLLESGLETLYSIILRAGMQRTWDTKGSTCIREISRTDQTLVSLTPWGSTCIYIAAGLQIALSLIALGAASVWYVSEIPLGPAIRIIRQPTYFMSVLCESPFAVNLVGTGNAQEHVIWQAIDVIVRIGEAFETMEEPVGRIKLERPKLVRPLSNGRMYA